MKMKYRVWRSFGPGVSDGGRFIEAISPEDAVEIWADGDDFRSAEFAIAKGDMPEVCVQLIGGGPVLHFRVRGWLIRKYSADLIQG